MKKLFSIVLAVAVLATMAFSMMGATASAAEKVSLLPAAASDFTTVDGGDGSITVSKEGDAFKFVANAGWPQAYYSSTDENAWAKAYINDADCYLNYDFEVKTGAANVIVFFCGQSPADQAGPGVGETINYLIDASNNNLASGQTKDLPVGKYKGSVHVKDLGVREDLILSEQGDATAADAYFTVSGMKVFAVGGEVIVNELSVGPKDGDATVVTTAANSDKPTTTAAKTTAKAGTDNAKTGDTTNAILFVTVAAVAAAVVTVSVVSKKQKAR